MNLRLAIMFAGLVGAVTGAVPSIATATHYPLEPVVYFASTLLNVAALYVLSQLEGWRTPKE